jgi:hypothetical protein
MNEQITVSSGEEITYASTDTLNDSPVPDMNLGKQYDFRRQQAKISNNSALALRPLQVSTTSPSPVSKSLPTSGAAVLGEQTAQNYMVSITSPKENAAIVTTLPLFQGTGIPGKYIGISIGFVNAIHGSVRVGQNGIWSFTPTRQLNQGNQTITISSIDSSGKPVAITQKFSILKSGTQVLGDATPSATLIPITTPNLTPTIISLETITGTPISTLSGMTPPTTGNEFPTIVLLIISLGMLAGGSVVILRN